MRTNNTRKGFTTVELVIVIAVIAILATVLIPTFSNMIESANLSVDKQNVRNMNVCLATYITADDPSDFGMVKERLKAYGYGTDNNFAAKTKNHSIRWFIDDKGTADESDDISMIILVNDETGKVVFPEEYADYELSKETIVRGDGTTFMRVDVRKYFDLSLPAAVVDKDYDVLVNGWDIGTLGEGNETISTMYTFKPASVAPNDKYGTWLADFYISLTKKDNTPLDTKAEAQALLGAVKLAGFYNGWSLGPFRDESNDGNEDWLILPVAGDNPDNNYDPVDILERNGEVPLVLTIMQSSDTDKADLGEITAPSYAMLLGQLKLENGPTYFKCGVVDMEGGADKDVTMKVELRLTNPEVADGSDYVVVGMYSYTFQ